MAESSEDQLVVLLNRFPGPLTLRPSTWKWLAFLAVGIAAVAWGAWLIRDPGLVSVSGWALVFTSPLVALGLARDTSQSVVEFGWFAVVFFAIGGAVCIIMLLPGAARDLIRLRLTDVGRARTAIVSLIVFPLVGPLALALTVAVPGAIVGLFSYGPVGLIYFLALVVSLMPALYALLDPAYLCVGVLTAMVEVIVKRLSLLGTLLTAEIAFVAYFAVWNWLPGIRLSGAHARMSSDLLQSPAWMAPMVLIGTAACWFVLRAMLIQLEAGSDLPWLWPASRWGRALMIAALGVATLSLAAVFDGSTEVPAIAWKDCESGSWDQHMRGCTAIIKKGSEESVEHRVDAYVNRGRAYEEIRHDLERAIADYSEAIRLAPGHAEAYAYRGLAYARLGKDDEAIADLDKAPSLDPKVLGVYAYQLYRSRGVAHFHRREFDRAIADHTEEIRQNRGYATGYLNRGRAYLAKGETAQAIADFSEAIRVEPVTADGYIERGSIHLAQRDADRALADFDEAIRQGQILGPNNRKTAPAYRKRGEVLESRGDLAAALTAFKTALRLDPSDKEAAAGRDRVRAALGR